MTEWKAWRDEIPVCSDSEHDHDAAADSTARQRTGETFLRALGSFFTSRRIRRDPSAVGLPADIRRRTPGLRREEVAVLAGVSPTWYTRLEQGRNPAPSTERLQRVAEVLGLTDQERRYLFELRRVAQEPPVRRGARVALREALSMVADMSHRYPAYVCNEYGDVLAWNPATTQWYTDFGRQPEYRRNIVWWMFTDRQARDRLANWPDEARSIVAHLRRSSVNWLGESRPSQLVHDLRISSPSFRRIWDAHPVCDHQPWIRHFRRPDGSGTVGLRLLVLHDATSSALSLFLHLPAGSRPTTPDRRPASDGGRAGYRGGAAGLATGQPSTARALVLIGVPEATLTRSDRDGYRAA
ncbi:helix-turn-helix transcriptional regulator [Solwaraspora sp. WMMD791]|uniref:helix-turn-helix transcriptional regulator n=1 Tax=Solwaraspora sp. WMMD791 TaxID=3016086 RepID=UPI00249A9AE2|nr:helix-turn-helix transcriptional regulator [Solwaraspora sp. WMMD791]WFE29019.1 helix-turn-helix transcriptional regulator [Solwaraspora sp. WMMD791]